MATLGNTGLPTVTNHTALATTYLVGSGPFVMSENGTATQMSMCVAGVTASTGALRTAIYSGTSITATTFVAVTSEFSVPANATSGFVNLPISASLVSGTSYWLAFWSGNAATQYYYNNSDNQYFRSDVPYSSGSNPPDPFGAGTSSAGTSYAIYVTYTPVTGGGGSGGLLLRGVS